MKVVGFEMQLIEKRGKRLSTLDGVAAGIVAFKPDRNVLIQLVQAAANETNAVFVFVNAVIDSDLLRELAEAGANSLVCDWNLGVAEAQNMLGLAALVAGYDRLLLLDQDSVLPAGAVAILTGTMNVLQRNGERPAVVGPKIRPPLGREQHFKAPRYFRVGNRSSRHRSIPVRYVISSGSLIDLRAFLAIGRMRSDFFIDAIDTEWCFRAWSKGFSCWCSLDVEMEHSIGTGVVRNIAGTIPKQAPFRLYAYARNQVYCSRWLSHISLGWKVMFCAHVGRVVLVQLLQDRFSPSTAALFWRAIVAGLGGYLGPPPDAERACRFSLRM